MGKQLIRIDGKSLSLETIRYFLDQNPCVRLSAESIKSVVQARKLIDEWVDTDEVIYGVTTGFGEFANVKVSHDELEQLQENLVMSHSTGVGEPLPPFIVKLMMLLRVNALARGHSGIRLSTINLLIDMMNNGIIPVIPSQGSVGSSGDLAPLSHLALCLIGMGKVQIIDDVNNPKAAQSKIIDSKKAFKKFGLEPIRLAAKEGLALTNGTQMMTAFAAVICNQARDLMKMADIAGSLSHEALRATDNAYDHRLHDLRPYPGQLASAQNLLALIKNSEIRKSHKEEHDKVQDSYSMRCLPQIHGASRDAIEYVCSRVEIELNSVNDNPLIFPKDKAHLEGGNFHGQPMALAMDFMKVALSELANVSERRIERLTNGSLSDLPRFLTPKGGLNSGFMIAQYTAAALVSENKTLAHPASVDSIPTSANQEDHNSMGSIASRHCYEILKNVQTVIAIEMLTAAQGIEFLKPLKCGKGSAIAYNAIRKHIKPMMKDRVLYKDIDKIVDMVRRNIILSEVEKSIKII